MTRFFEMGNGNLIECAGRGKTEKEIEELQQEEWVKKQGGITWISKYTSPRAIYFAQKQKKR